MDDFDKQYYMRKGLLEDPTVPKSDIGKELSAGWSNYKAGMQHIGAALGSTTGAEWAAENEDKAKYLQSLSKAPHSWDEMQFGDKDKGLLPYIGQLAAGAAPYIAEQAAFALGDVATGGALTPAHAVRIGEIGAKVLARQGASTAAETAIKKGIQSTVVGTERSYPSSSGSLLKEQHDETGEYNIPAAAGLAVPYSLLNAGLGVEGAVARGGLHVPGIKNRFLRGAATGVVTGAEESAGEAGQAFIENVAHKSVNPGYNLLGDEALHNIKESAIGGFVLGKVSGTAGGLLSSAKSPLNSDDDAVKSAINTGSGYTPTFRTPEERDSAKPSPLVPLIVTPSGDVLRNQTQVQAYNDFGKNLQGPAPADTATIPATTSAQQSQQVANANVQATQQVADANAQAQQAAKAKQEQEDAEARNHILKTVGVITNDKETKGNLFGALVFGKNFLHQIADIIGPEFAKLPEIQRTLINALQVATNKLGSKERYVKFKFKGDNVAKSVEDGMKAVNAALLKLQIDHVTSVQEAAEILNERSKTETGNDLLNINAVHEALTGKNTVGYEDSLKPKETKTTKQTAKGEKDGKQTEQQQVPARVGDVPVTGGATETGNGNLGLLQSTSLGSIGSGSNNGITNSQQDVGTGEVGPRDNASGAITSTNDDQQKKTQRVIHTFDETPLQGEVTNEQPAAGSETGSTTANVPATISRGNTSSNASGQIEVSPDASPAHREAALKAPQRWDELTEHEVPFSTLAPALQGAWLEAYANNEISLDLVDNLIEQNKPTDITFHELLPMILDRVISRSGKMRSFDVPKIRHLLFLLLGSTSKERDLDHRELVLETGLNNIPDVDEKGNPVLNPITKKPYTPEEAMQKALKQVENWEDRAKTFYATYGSEIDRILPIIAKEEYGIDSVEKLREALIKALEYNRSLKPSNILAQNEIGELVNDTEVELNALNDEGEAKNTGINSSDKRHGRLEERDEGKIFGDKYIALQEKIEEAEANGDLDTVDKLNEELDKLVEEAAKADKKKAVRNLSAANQEKVYSEQAEKEDNKKVDKKESKSEKTTKKETKNQVAVVKTEKPKKITLKSVKDAIQEAYIQGDITSEQQYDLELLIKNKGLSASELMVVFQRAKDDKAGTGTTPAKTNSLAGALKAAGIDKYAGDEKNGPVSVLTDESNTIEGEAKEISITELALALFDQDVAAGYNPYQPSDWSMGRNRPAKFENNIEWLRSLISESPNLARVVVQGYPVKTIKEVESKLADNSRTIEGEARVVSMTPEQTVLLTDQTNKLTDGQNKRLEEHYKVKRGTPEFIARIKADVLTFANDGAKAVAGAVRDIIRQIANGVMSVAIIFNPGFVSDPIKFAVPTYETRTEQVVEKAPSEAAKNMSPAAQRAYEVIFPAIKENLATSNKFFIVTDKPTATQFIFKPDGTLLFQSKVLVGKSVGDFLKGNNNIDANKITPAGLMTLVMRENTSSTKGYDFNTVFGVEGVDNGDKYFTTLMHSVWLNEKDAAQRQKALSEAGPGNSRYSFGCINTDKDTFGKLLKDHKEQMNGAMLFVVPDNQESVMEFVNGKAVFEKDITRQGVTPKTKTVVEKTTPKGVEASKGTQVAGREEKSNVQFSKTAEVANPEQASVANKELKAFIGDISNARLEVVQSIEGLPLHIQNIVREKQRLDGSIVQALVYKNKAYMIADNIEKGTTRAVFMHEVGSHLGLEKLLSTKQYAKLVDTLDSWVAKNDGSIESDLASKAFIRSLESKEVGEKRTKEFVAYFIEEAVKAGINPTAVDYKTGTGRWFIALWAAFKNAIRKLGFNPDKMNAKDVVNLAYGAARLEVHGNWHGTANAFRKFNHDYMGSGEGNQAFGWGTYLAQRLGIGRDYMGIAIKANTKKPDIWYNGKSINELVEKRRRTSDSFFFVEALLSIKSEFIANPDLDIEAAIKEAIDTTGIALPDNKSELQEYENDLHQTLYADVNLYETEALRDHMAEDIQYFIDELKEKIEAKEKIIEHLKKLNPKDISIIPAVNPKGYLLRVDTNVKDEELLDLDKPLDQQSAIVKRALKKIPQAKYADDAWTGREFYNFLAKDLFGNKPVITKADKMGDIKGASMLLDSVGIKGNLYLDLPSRDEDAPKNLQTRNKVIFNDENIFKIATLPQASIDDIQFSVAQPISAVRVGAQKKIDSLPLAYRGPVHAIFDTIEDIAKKGAIMASFTEDLASVAKKYIPSVVKYVALMKERSAIRTMRERRVDDILTEYQSLNKSVKGIGPGTVNAFLMKSTMEKKWAYQPSWLKDPVTIDPEMKKQFDALIAKDKKAGDLIKKVFEHGFTDLTDMKESIQTNISTEYDALIKQAEDEGNEKEVAELQKKKADELRDFRSLLGIQANLPYAPLKRFGNYVVVGKSAKYLEAEKQNDRALIRELEKDGNEYFVQFADTWYEAKAISRAQEGKYALVEPFEKDTAQRAMYGGKDVNDVFERLRTLADNSLEGGSEKSKKAVDSLLVSLKLSLLSQHSARQSENHRRNIAGAEEDMMRSFATQGRANAHFISSLHNTDKIYDQLRAMKEEADASTEGRGERRRYYNEFIKRHSMGFNYQSNPLMDKALGVTSLWMLLSSPAHFLQNATQPFMMSMPVIAGKHGEGKTFKAMLQAYKEIGSLIRSEGLTEKTYAKLPADVREAIETLVNSGRIDISLESDLGAWKSDESKNVASIAIEKLRRISQDIESINRVVTAVAAYRLEKASGKTKEEAIAYADQIILDTHGDYSGFNAPRFTRQGIGRFMTQFRKFQLIQISLIAKLGHQAFKGVGKDAEETKNIRSAGKKALAFTLGHTFAAAGVMGMPGFAAIAWIIGKVFGDDDEPDNPEATLRKVIGDDSLSDLLLKGIPKLTGVDLSGKLGMGQMLSILPYTDIDLSRDGYARAVTAAMGPFIGGLVPKAVDGVGLMTQGNYYKGLEAIAPKGIADALKSVEIANKGITQRNGDVVLSADDIGVLDVMSQALGLPTNTITDKQFIRNAEYQSTKFYKERSTDLKTDYVRAFREGDTETMADIRQKWEETQVARVRNGEKRQPMSELFKAPQEQVKREKDIKGGIAKSSLASGITER